MRELHVDFVIVGAGITGLWLLNRLSSVGYSVVLLENKAIGSGQTIWSQGIIHGGTKYALKGMLTNATSEISKMTQVWSDCVAGGGEIDLSSVNILSQHHYLWSRGQFTAGLKSFIGSKMVASESNVVSKSDYPNVFKNKGFRGSLCRLSETVFDVPSLIDELSKPYRDQVLLAGAQTKFKFTTSGDCEAVQLDDANLLKAKKFIFTAGAGNEEIFKKINGAPQMQRRPLNMVYLIQDELPQIYAHCVDKGTLPRMTVTTHPTKDGRWAWYLGGNLAEAGIERTHDEQIAAAKAELADLLPWVDVSQAEFHARMIDRCEGQMPGNKRPDTPIVKNFNNNIVIWPTKLTFAPWVAKIVLEQCVDIEKSLLPDLSDIKKAPLGVALWDS